MKDDPRWPKIAPLVRGGFWRNFKRKYPEADEMYCRMQMVSQRLQEATDAGLDSQLLDRARTELYRGQCNCSYWHGAFGGIYLPHLRNAIYRHLIAADNLLEELLGRSVHGDGEGWVEASSGDFNFDARPEVRLTSDRLIALIAPARGGQIYELDVRTICHNLLATLTRRPEAYHAKVLAGAHGADDGVSSIHDRVVFKQEGLDQQVVYDSHPRKSLIDHFYDPSATVDQVATGQATERGDFVQGQYTARIRRNPERVQVMLSRAGHVGDVPVTITKGVTLAAGSSSLEIAYLLENLPPNQPLHFAVELGFAGLPAAADDRYFYAADHEVLGDLGQRLDLTNASSLGLVDQWLDIDLCLSLDRPGGIWTFPIQSVSQSEGGFELVHQSTVVLPHWIVRGDAEGRWSVTLTLDIETPATTNPAPQAAVAAAAT
jgi:alpha-amylase